MAVHVASAAAGLSALMASSVLAIGGARYLGAAYLISFGLRTLVTDDDPQQEGEERARGDCRVRRAYLQGTLVNAPNTKVALFFLGFLPQFAGHSRGANIQILGGIVYLALGAAAAVGGESRRD